MRDTKNFLLTLALVAAIALFSIHLANRWLGGARADLTADDVYSLTPGSHAILERMGDEGVKPLDVRLYFSETAGKTLPKFIKDFVTYERYIRTLLDQYESASQGKVRVETIDPVPDSDAADRAAEDGLDGKLINQNGDLFYFGLAFETQTGGRDTVDFLWPAEQENIEYEISKKIHGLLWPGRKRIGVLSSLEVLGGADDPFMAQMLAAQGRAPARPWIAIEVLREVYDVEAIDRSAAEISADDYDLVVVIHPKDLPKKTLFALDQWVTAGGSTLVFLDPYAISDEAPQNPQQPWASLQYEPSSNLEPLLAAWGLERPENRFAADFDLAVRRPVGPMGGAESVVVDLRITGERGAEVLAVDSPILQGMSDLRFLLAGALDLVGEPKRSEEATETEGSTAEAGDGAGGSDGIERLPLITTTAGGSTLTIEPGFGGSGGLAYTDLNEPAKLRDQLSPGSAPVALAYLVRGRLPTAYPKGIDVPATEHERPPGLPPGIELPAPEDTEMIHRDPLLEEERGEAAVIVFADVDFIDDQVAFSRHPLGFVEAANDNHRVFLNAVDYLLGSEALMAVRAKKGVSRPFLLFDRIEEEAERETLDREREIRDSIVAFQSELQTKQNEITQRNAALFEKRLQDEVDALNEQLAGANRELREIRKSRRARLEREESTVRFAVMGWMPLVILGIGVWRVVERRRRPQQEMER